MATDEDLEKQAEEMAQKALPATLPESVRKAKLPAVKQKILDRLKAQREEKGPAPAAAAPAGAAPPGPAAPPAAPGGSPAAPPPPPAGAAPPAPPVAAWAPPPPPPDAKEVVTPKVANVELCGDEPWFAEAAVRRRLREFVAEAHKEQKILVGAPADEVVRICPEDGRLLGAGGVLRLGGAHLGGYGESDIAYAYRQLSRALHPDKNPDLPKAPAAFHRLSEAADELREGLNQQRHALQLLVSAMGGTATDQMCERPQEALFAEACRMLSAICGLAGEGEVPPPAHSRALGAFSRSGMYHGSQPQSLLSDWFEKTQLVDLFGSTTLRTAYDCAPKRYRAQFLCLLNRAAVVEAKRFNDCVRSQWHVIMQSYPELGLWRSMWDMISSRVWDSSSDPPEVQREEKPKSRSRSRRRKSRSRSRRRRSRSGRRKEPEDGRPRGGVRAEIEYAADRQRDIAWENRWTTSDDPNAPKVNSKTRLREEKKNRKRSIEEHPTTGVRACKWGRKWRAAICAVLPSGLDGATRPDDLEVRKFGFHLWKEIVKWAAGTDAERVLGLFRADMQSARTFGWENKGEQNPASRGLDPDTPPCDWAFVPVTDLLLAVGEGVIGVTAEGLVANNPSGHKRLPTIQCFKKPGQKKSEAEKALAAALTAASMGQGARPAGPIANGSEAPPMMMPPSMMMGQQAAMMGQAKPSKWDVI